ncbi:phosphatase PAP2 family protein [bacterium]|nr:phosphatase PAP2 family protein [bacterium]
MLTNSRSVVTRGHPDSFILVLVWLFFLAPCFAAAFADVPAIRATETQSRERSEWIGFRLGTSSLDPLFAGGESADDTTRVPRDHPPAGTVGSSATPAMSADTVETSTWAGSLFSDPSPGPMKRLGRDLLRTGEVLGRDLVYVYSAPARTEWRDLVWVAAALGAGYGIYAFDREIFDAMQDIRDDRWYHPVRETGEFFEPLGTKAFTEAYYVGGLVAGYIFGIGPLRDISADMLESVYLSVPVLGLTKYGTGRVRPRNGGTATQWFDDGGSFVSGHTANMFQMAGVLSRHIPRYGSWIGYTLATTVALERITSSDHWPSDVYAGALWGWFITEQMFHQKRKRTIHVQPLITGQGQGVGLGFAWRF